MAENEAKNNSYITAIEKYEDILKKNKNLSPEDLIKVKLKLAEAYFLVKEYKNAEKYYSEVLYNNPVLKGDEIKAYQRFAQVLSSLKKPTESGAMWLKYNELQDQDKRGQEFYKLYQNLEPLTRNANSYSLEYIGINSSEPEFSPAYYKNGLVFVSSRPKNRAIKRVFKWDNSSFLDLYYLEDLKVLSGKEENAALGGGSNPTVDNKKAKSSDKLGTDYYTPPTSNDGNTIAHTGSEFLNKKPDEKASIEVKSFSRKLNSKYHEGPCTFFENGEKIIFTRNGSSGIFNNKKEDVNRLKLFSAEKKNSDWGSIKELPFNSEKYSCGHPSVSFDSKYLFFVSDMAGGFGGTDVYYSKYENGIWNTPVNAGGKINTVGNEMFPFIDENFQLYFSSDGHPGLGELDIFSIKLDLENLKPIGVIRNLGAPLNSSNDDFGLITNGDRSLGYFSTNRKKGGGSDDDIWKFTRNGQLFGCRDLIVKVFDKNSKTFVPNARFSYQNVNDQLESQTATCNDDGSIKICIPADENFEFSINDPLYKPYSVKYNNSEASDYEPFVLELNVEKIVILAKKDEDKKSDKKDNQRLVQRKSSGKDSNIFRGVITGGESGSPISAVKVKFINKSTGDVQEMYTKKDGSYEFKRNLENDYELIASKDDFGVSSEIIEKAIKKTLFGKKLKPANTYSLNYFDTKLFKVGDVIKLENIYYEYDSYKIRENAKKDLDKLVNTLKKYPDMIVEISSHTDTRGNEVTNLQLSQKRANEVLKYISSSKIAKNRLKAIGKGETEPLNKCGDGVQCTEAEHQRNRRTEFKILKIQKK